MIGAFMPGDEPAVILVAVFDGVRAQPRKAAERLI
jgi:hypothetical protein